MANILIREAVEQTQTLYSKGIKSRSSRLASRYIYSTLIKVRATILKQQINKRQAISQWAYQEIPCMEFERVIIGNTDTELLRTKHRVPTIISGLDGKMVGQLTNIDGSCRFDIKTEISQRYSKGNKYTAKKPIFYLRDQFGVINFKSKLQGATLSSVFYNPIEAALFPSGCSDCEDCGCKDMLDFGFYVDGDMLETVTKIAADELIVMFTQMREDKSNNATDDNISGGQMIHTSERRTEDD